MAIFIPRTIRVGYQKRQDTYTGFLAYIIYLDAKGKVRKETSWESWRDKKIEPQDFENKPTSGFVLNKKAGGTSSGWNHRQTYCRVYDPRGFEFEVTIPNLLYILDNVSSIKGKGLEGKFVYAWEGAELFLMPVSAPDYAEIKDFSDTKFSAKKLRGADMILGATYRTKKDDTAIYMGRYDLYEDSHWDADRGKNKGKRYFFFVDGRYGKEFRAVSSVGSFVLDVIDEDCVQNYAELMDKLEHSAKYSAFSHHEYQAISEEKYRETMPYRAYVKIDGEFFEVRLDYGLRFWGIPSHYRSTYDRRTFELKFTNLVPEGTPREDYCKYATFYEKGAILANGKVEGGKWNE